MTDGLDEGAAEGTAEGTAEAAVAWLIMRAAMLLLVLCAGCQCGARHPPPSSRLKSGSPGLTRGPAAAPQLSTAQPITGDEALVLPQRQWRVLDDGTRVELLRFEVEVAATDFSLIELEGRPLREVAQAEGFSLVVNAGFFSVNGSPIGLSQEGYSRYSKLDVELGGGVFEVAEGGASLAAAEVYELKPRVDLALQCRPRLVVGGRVNIRSDDGKRADRTALCIKPSGERIKPSGERIKQGGERVEVVVAYNAPGMSRKGPTLFQLAQWLQQLGCEDALNLDGGPSTSVAWREADGSFAERAARGPVMQALGLRAR